MKISLTTKKINATISDPKVAKGLEQYLWLQLRVARTRGFHKSAEFRKRYNNFYRVYRRNAAWYDKFYSLMDRKKKIPFPKVLKSLFKNTGRYEASFASKLVATMNPSMPVIDSKVLKNIGSRLPYSYAPNREILICKLYEELVSLSADFLKTRKGKYLVCRFKHTYPYAKVTDEKMLDFVLWKMDK